MQTHSDGDSVVLGTVSLFPSPPQGSWSLPVPIQRQCGIKQVLTNQHHHQFRGSTPHTGQIWRGWILVLVCQRCENWASLEALHSYFLDFNSHQPHRVTSGHRESERERERMKINENGLLLILRMLKIHRQTVASVIVKDLQTDSCISNTNRRVKQKQGNVGRVSCCLQPSLWLWDMNPDSDKKMHAFKTQVPEETSTYLLLGAQDQQLGAQQDQLSCAPTGTPPGNCQETETHIYSSGMSSPKPSFKVSNTMVSRQNAGWKTSKSGCPFPCCNCSRWPRTEKTEKRSLLICLSCPPDDLISQGQCTV